MMVGNQGKLKKEFFSRDARVVARELLGKVLVRKIGENVFRAKIVETEAYLDGEDPGSRAKDGKTKISEMMWESPGKIMIYNVHLHKMLNFVTSEKEKPEEVLIRALEPLNFEGRCSGPGLLTNFLKIDKSVHGKDVFDNDLIWVENSEEKPEIEERFRIGLRKDSDEKRRFYIKDSRFVSRK